LVELAKRRYEAVGIEISRPMIDHAFDKARKASVKLELLEGNMSDFILDEPVDAAFCAIDTFRYLLTENSALSHLSCVARSLRPEGIYIIDFTLVGLLGSYPKPAEEWTIEREDASVTVSHKIVGLPDLEKRRTIERTILTVTEAGLTKKIETEDPMRTYTKNEFEALLHSGGFFELVAWHGPDFSIEREENPRPETARVIAVLKKK